MRYKYSWDDPYKAFINSLYHETISNLRGNERLTESIIHEVEDYMHYLINCNYNRGIIIDKLRGIANGAIEGGITFTSNLFATSDMHTTRPVVVYLNKIAINKDKSIDESLSEKERIRYNLYLGLSHKAVNLRSSSAAKFSETYDLIAEGGKQNGYIAYNGWLLMEELLSLELANRAFNNNYGYQKIDITNENYLPSELTSTIPKLDGSNNTDNVLAASVNGKLSDILINKYTKENRRFELYSLIYLMGLLNLDKERLYGIDPLPELKVNQSEYKQVLAAINNILDGNTEKNMSDIKTRLRKLKTTHEI